MFGMSVFQSVLERLKAEQDEESGSHEARETLLPVRGLNGGFVRAIDTSGPFASGTVQRAYLDTAGEDMFVPPKPMADPVMPDHLARIAPHDVAWELGLKETDTVTLLAEKRRRFAAENHPDRHHRDFRANATLRMKIANMLIDEALRRLRAPRID
ncbi:hypothetical protein [Pararhizobium gei]|uniref:hypothetical protein n=1 Tax=Pararhizobium gei TaxID=1395951 RepID=UPI0023DAC1CF|nr:hypothetical protein [Rhizobium gei]